MCAVKNYSRWTVAETWTLISVSTLWHLAEKGSELFIFG